MALRFSLSFQVAPGELLVVVGATASGNCISAHAFILKLTEEWLMGSVFTGKSSLLSAILGEIPQIGFGF